MGGGCGSGCSVRRYQMCIVQSCQADARPCGCGYQSAGQPCGHSQHRDEWAVLSHRLHGDERDDAALERVREVMVQPRELAVGQLALL